MKILIVKLSSLGDVVHAMPAVQDILAAIPSAEVDWVVEKSFAPLVQRCIGVRKVIGCELRKWRKSPLGALTRSEWRAFRDELRHEAYDAVIDLQGLTKSALVARTARLTPSGKRFAMANRTDGSSYEAPTRWVADVAIRIEPHVHAVARSRELCAKALRYAVRPELVFGLRAAKTEASNPPCVAFIHGTSRADKLWPESHWVELGQRLVAHGFVIGLPHGSDEELQRSESLAHAWEGHAQVWPRLDLGSLADRLAGCAGAIGVDSGLSHIAVALDLPHVQIYNFDTAWRTGPPTPTLTTVHPEPVEGPGPSPRQLSLYAHPTPTVDAVWSAWQRAQAAR